MIDFIERLHEYVEGLAIQFPVHIGALDREESLALYALPGGKTKKEYYDGVKDKLLNYEFSIKTKEQKKADDTLALIAQKLENVADIPSGNGSYDFIEITIGSEPFFRGGDEQGFFFYCCTIQAELTVYNEDEGKDDE